MIPYRAMPKVSVFQSDSSGVGYSPRPGDPGLALIDETLAQYHSNHGRVMFQAAKLREAVILGRLYSHIDLWLKEANKKNLGGKWSTCTKPTVQSLYEVACHALAKRAGCPINQLPFWITETFGRGMSEHGVELDLDKGFAKYMDQPEADLCRIKFDGGRAYMRMLGSASVEYTPASSEAYKDDRLFAPGFSRHLRGHSGYVLSMGGDFFMGAHSVGGARGAELNVYHSSYRAGEAVRCAGTWKVEGGVVKEISDASGHYKPNVNHMISAVETLKGYGVNISELLVHYFSKGEQVVGVKASDFLRDQTTGSPTASRAGYLQGQVAETAARKKLSR